MPNPEDDCLTQKAMWWSVTGKDRNNNTTLAAGVEIDTRWERGNKESVDRANTTVAFDSTVILDRDVEVGDMMRLGAQVDTPDPPDNIREVMDFQKIPDIKGRNFRRIALLVKHSGTLPQLT